MNRFGAGANGVTLISSCLWVDVRRLFFIIGIVAEVKVVSVITDKKHIMVLYINLISNARVQTNLGLVARNQGRRARIAELGLEWRGEIEGERLVLGLGLITMVVHP